MIVIYSESERISKVEIVRFIDASINKPLSRQPRENTTKNIEKYILLALMKIPIVSPRFGF